MEPIKLVGVKILKSYKTQKSVCRKVLIELTEYDSMTNAAAIAGYEQVGMMFDVVLQPTEVESVPQSDEATT